MYIDKKNGQLFNSGRKGAYCPTTISEGVRKKKIQDFRVNVKWKKSGKQEMSFDGGQKVESAFAEALKNAGFYVGCYVIKDANTLRYKLHEVLTISKEGMPPIQSEADLDGELLRSDIPSSNIISQQDTNDNKK